MEIFNIHLEFDHEAFRNAIEKSVEEKGKGYVCVVDGNVLTMTRKDETYRRIVRNASFNTCDGSSIAEMCNRIYGTDYTAYSGPQIFSEYVERSYYRQLLLGNTQECFDRIKVRLGAEGKTSEHLSYMSLPFVGIEDFEYPEIGRQINLLKPDLIWISLGAPKQEYFCSKLLPYIDSGLMFGIGAAFNFYVGDVGQSRSIWFKRIFQEPKKQIKRCMGYIWAMPRIFIEEKKRSRLTER